MPINELDLLQFPELKKHLLKAQENPPELLPTMREYTGNVAPFTLDENGEYHWSTPKWFKGPTDNAARPVNELFKEPKSPYNILTGMLAGPAETFKNVAEQAGGHRPLEMNRITDAVANMAGLAVGGRYKPDTVGMFYGSRAATNLDKDFTKRFAASGSMAKSPVMEGYETALAAYKNGALTPEEMEAIRVQTGWSSMRDNRLRFEGSDANVKYESDAVPTKNGLKYVEEGNKFKLNELIDHPEAYTAMPELRDVNVLIVPNHNGKTPNPPASYNRSTNTIKLTEALAIENDKGKSALLHEMQHIIGDKEGFSSGGNKADITAAMIPADIAMSGHPFDWQQMETYRRLVGEIEARNTQKREKYSLKNRLQRAPDETADYVPWQQVVLDGRTSPVAHMIAGLKAMIGPKREWAREAGFESPKSPGVYQEVLDLGGTPEQAMKYTGGWHKNEANQLGFEVPDAGMKLKEGYKDLNYFNGEKTINDIIDHTALIEQYPHLGGITVKPTGLFDFGLNGAYDPKTNTIFLKKGMPEAEARKTVLHELQHAIQETEGWQQGGNLDTFLSAADKDILAGHQGVWDELYKQRNDPKFSIATAILGNKYDVNFTDSTLRDIMHDPKRAKRVATQKDPFVFKDIPEETLARIKTDIKKNPLLVQVADYSKLYHEGIFKTAKIKDAAYKNYRDLYGERQSRLTEERADLTPADWKDRGILAEKIPLETKDATAGIRNVPSRTRSGDASWSAVEHDPFVQADALKMIPVDHDPFK